MSLFDNAYNVVMTGIEQTYSGDIDIRNERSLNTSKGERTWNLS